MVDAAHGDQSAARDGDGPCRAGLATGGLAARSTPMSKAELRAGDLLLNLAPGRAGHVVIFDHWTDVSMTGYVGYEQSLDGGTHHRTFRTRTLALAQKRW